MIRSKSRKKTVLQSAQNISSHKTSKNQLGNRAVSEARFIIEPEQKQNIPRTKIRFHGKFQEVVSVQYKAMRESLEKKRKEEEQKKEEVKQRALKAKCESEKVRKTNQKLQNCDLHSVAKSKNKKSPERGSETKRRLVETRHKEKKLEILKNWHWKRTSIQFVIN